MRDFNGQFKLNFEDNSDDKNDDNKVVHLSSDEFIELETTDPIAHRALKEKMDEEMEAREEKNDISEMEASVKSRERFKDLEKDKNIKELRESIARAFNENREEIEKEKQSIFDESDYKPGEYEKYYKIAQEIKNTKIKKEEQESSKNKYKIGNFNKKWNSIQDIFRRDNLR